MGDLFCGASRLSYGFAEDDFFELVLTCDIDKNATLSYQANHLRTEAICKDVGAFGKDELGGCAGADILLGGPPCQSYFTLGKRQMDKRANLFKEYLRMLKFLTPKAFVFENVVGLLFMQKGKLFSYIYENFEKLGYKTYHRVLNAADFGVPQIRQRVIVVEIRREFGGDFVILEWAIDDLLPSVRPRSSCAKMWWKKPAPTITKNFATSSRSRCIHPRDSRALGIREGARLQGLPDDYILCGSASDENSKLGNAMPPLLSMALAKATGRLNFSQFKE